MANGLCLFCGNPILPSSSGEGKCMMAKIVFYIPGYPNISTTYEGRWVCHNCTKKIANNVSDSDSNF
jgi:hypothetical protein